MTSQENKPREFWIWNNWFGENDACMYIYGMTIDQMSGINPDDKIHVIEYSAFKQLKKENEELKERLDLKFEAYSKLDDINIHLNGKVKEIEKENEELKFRLLDRSEKYSIAIDKGVLEQHYKINKLTAALKAAEDALTFTVKESGTSTNYNHKCSEALAEIKKIKGDENGSSNNTNT